MTKLRVRSPYILSEIGIYGEEDNFDFWYYRNQNIFAKNLFYKEVVTELTKQEKIESILEMNGVKKGKLIIIPTGLHDVKEYKECGRDYWELKIGEVVIDIVDLLKKDNNMAALHMSIETANTIKCKIEKHKELFSEFIGNKDYVKKNIHFFEYDNPLGVTIASLNVKTKKEFKRLYEELLKEVIECIKLKSNTLSGEDYYQYMNSLLMRDSYQRLEKNCLWRIKNNYKKISKRDSNYVDYYLIASDFLRIEKEFNLKINRVYSIN